MSRLRPLLGLVAVVAACGSSMTVPDYFAALEEAAVQFDRNGNDLNERFNVQLENSVLELERQLDLDDAGQLEELTRRAGELAVSTTVDLLLARGEGLARFVQALGELDPPAVAADEHARALAAGRDTLESLPEVVDQVRSVQSLEELAPTIAASRFGEAQQRFNESCRELQTVADAEQVEVDLRCGVEN